MTKNFKALIWTVAILLIIAGSYVLWNKFTTPPRLLLKNIKPSESLNLEYVNQLGGVVSSGQIKPIVVNDNLVYVGMGPRLAILDISDPSNIYLVGQSEIIPDLIGDIVLVGNYIYIAPGGYGDDVGANQELHIVDVSNPTQPQYVGAYSPQDKYVSSVYAFGKYLYITAKEVNSDFRAANTELYILDISNPIQPKEISHYNFNTGISDVAASGSYVYVAMYKPGLRILDVSDLQNPKEIKKLYPSGGEDKLEVSGNYLYLSGSTKDMPWGFHVLDISNPREPVEIAVQDEGASQLTSLYQNTAYLWSMGDQSSIRFIDISEPKEPKNTGVWKFDGRVVSIQADIAFVMDANRLVLFELLGSPKPVELGSYKTLIPDDTLPELYLNRTKGIVPVSTDMYILDFSNSVLPVIANQYLVGSSYRIESIHGDFVYMDTAKEIQVLDISDPTKPTIIWSHDGFDRDGQPFILATAEKYAYLINSKDGFYVYDIADPGNPTLI